MSSPWAKIATPVETVNFADIMSEEYALRLQDSELKKFGRICDAADRKQHAEASAASVAAAQEQTASIWDDVPCGSGSQQKISYAEAAQLPAAKMCFEDDDDDWEDCSELLKEAAQAAAAEGEELSSDLLQLVQLQGDDAEIDSDEVIALMLQSQFDHEYNKELRRIEEKHNKQNKIAISMDNYRRNGDMEFFNEPDDCDEDDELDFQKPNDDENSKKLETLQNCGFMINKENGEMIAKQGGELSGSRKPRVSDLPASDGSGFEIKLSHEVFNQLKIYSRRGAASGFTQKNYKRNTQTDRRENLATAEFGVDGRTRLLLYKLINNQILEEINGIISTGKEAVILHAKSDPNYSGVSPSNGEPIFALLPPALMPKECAIKIFKTTLNEFKQRDRYIKDDYRFKERFSKQNNRVIINLWAEKEMHNMMRMKSVGINCPDVVVLKQHVLVMSFIGNDHNAAPKLKDAFLSAAELRRAYAEIVESMFTLYNKAKLVHADLSEYNILWHEGKCWFIDVAQSVEPKHPSALEFLMRDCSNITSFFNKRGLSDMLTKEKLFEYITALDAESHNVAMLERIFTRGASIKQATAPNQDDCPDELKPLAYPFDYAWETSLADREKKPKAKIEDAEHALKELSVNCEDIAMDCEQIKSAKKTTNVVKQ